MYVCLCNGHTDRQIREAAGEGGKVSAVYRRLGSRPRCGKCVAHVKAVLSAAAGEEQPSEG